MSKRSKAEETKMSPTERTRSFVVSDQATEIIDGMSGGDVRYSNALNLIVERYAEMVRQHLPDQSVEEWKLLYQMLPEPHLASLRYPWMVGLIEHGLADAVQAVRIKSSKARAGMPEVAKLQERLAGMSYAEKVAVVTTLERYAAAKARGETPKFPGED